MPESRSSAAGVRSHHWNSVSGIGLRNSPAHRFAEVAELLLDESRYWKMRRM
jgi:hypothetical protein